jgi:transcriptional regulator with XRE-family HTH domain
MPAKKQPQYEFGQRLTALRLARGLTQVQLASILDVSQRAISRLETVAEFPTVPLLIALCAALHASADELLGLKAPRREAAPRQLPEEKRLWRHLKVVASLPERDQRAVLRIIDTAARAGR